MTSYHHIWQQNPPSLLCAPRLLLQCHHSTSTDDPEICCIHTYIIQALNTWRWDILTHQHTSQTSTNILRQTIPMFRFGHESEMPDWHLAYLCCSQWVRVLLCFQLYCELMNDTTRTAYLNKHESTKNQTKRLKQSKNSYRSFSLLTPICLE